ncbi:MAG: hypothetical protein KAY32_16395 [Candidatus Eisenbacteria sp.]|nr:hypothetical protein [Candidatus Eisenbacteria bacterium]
MNRPIVRSPASLYLALMTLVLGALIPVSCSNDNRATQPDIYPGTSALTASESPGCVLLYGPERFLRLSPPETVSRDVGSQLLQYFSQPMFLHVRNGDVDGRHRVSSATITIDGVVVVSPSEFNQHVEEFSLGVNLDETSVLEIRITSDPYGYLDIWIDGFLTPGSALMGPEGGTIEIIDPDSPIYGASMFIPQGVLPELTFVTLSPLIDPPEIGLPYMDFLGPVVNASASREVNADASIEITVPLYQLPPETTIPLGGYFDGAEWVVTEHEYMPGDDHLTIYTNHLSSFGALGLIVSRQFFDALLAETEVSEILAAAGEEMDEYMRCEMLGDLRSALVDFRDDNIEIIESFTEWHELCVEHVCPDIEDLGTYIVESTSEIVTGTTAIALIKVLGAVGMAKFFAVFGIVVAAPCAVCAVATSWLSPPVVDAYIKYTLAEIGIGAIDKTIDEEGCNETEGLVAYYPFNGCADDETGNGHGGEVHGAVLAADCEGRANSAYEFDGVGDYIRVSDSAGLRLDELTLAAVLYLHEVTDPSGEDAIFWKQYSANDASYDLEILAGDRRVEFALNRGSSNPEGGTLISAGSLSLNTWYHIAATYDGSHMKLYINGSPQGTLPYSGTAIAYDNGILALGADAPQSVHYIDGVMDDLRIYSRALSQSEVLDLVPGCTD